MRQVKMRPNTTSLRPSAPPAPSLADQSRGCVLRAQLSISAGGVGLQVQRASLPHSPRPQVRPKSRRTVVGPPNPSPVQVQRASFPHSPRLRPNPSPRDLSRRHRHGSWPGLQVSLAAQDRHTVGLGGASTGALLQPLVRPEVANRRGSRLVVRAGKDEEPKGPGISFGDRLLDYIEGGPKLRRWYGAAELMPRDGSIPEEEDNQGSEQPQEQEEEEEEGPADAVLVTNGDSETGQMVVLSLILKRRRIRTLVKDAEIAAEGFGPYVEPITGAVTDAAAVRKALRGVGTVIITDGAGLVPELARGRRVEHIVLLSQVGVGRPPSSPFAFLGAGARESSKKDEAAVAGSGIAHTVVRTGQLKDEPSGMGVQIGQGDELRGSLAREDAAAVCLAVLEAGPPKGPPRVFEAVNSTAGVSEDGQILDEISSLSVALSAE